MRLTRDNHELAELSESEQKAWDGCVQADELRDIVDLSPMRLRLRTARELFFGDRRRVLATVAGGLALGAAITAGVEFGQNAPPPAGRATWRVPASHHDWHVSDVPSGDPAAIRETPAVGSGYSPEVANQEPSQIMPSDEGRVANRPDPYMHGYDGSITSTTPPILGPAYGPTAPGHATREAGGTSPIPLPRTS